MAAESPSDPARALARLSLAFEDVAADIRRGAEAGGLTLSEVRLLDGIAQGVTGARVLSRRLRLDEGHVSRMVKRLKQAELITAERQMGDSRRVTLGLGKEGHRRLQQAIEGAAAAAAAHLEDRGAEAGQALVAALDLLREDRAAPKVKLTPMAPGDAGWVIARHAVHYADDAGFDHRFEAEVARIVAGFLAEGATDRQQCWIARAGVRPVGCIFCVEAAGAADTAQLRLFLVDTAWRGRGIGWDLLSACHGFAVKAGYKTLILYTHEEHAAACRLYAAFGFALQDSRPIESYGRALTEQIWALPLDAPLAKRPGRG